MNRLFYNRCYLSGPIDNAKDFGVGWRQMAQKELADLNLIFFDPCNKPMQGEYACEDLENHQYRLELKQRGDFETLSRMMRTIRCIDLRLADLCDFAIVHLDLDVYSTGTHEEIVTMNRRKVPILTHVQQGKAALPEWYLGTLPHEMVFSTWLELFAYLRHIAYGASPIETLKRWQFLDYGRLYNMDTIPLTRDKVTVISPEDYDYLKQWKWHAAKKGFREPYVYYAERGTNSKKGRKHGGMHQDVVRHMGATIPKGYVVDHINRNPLDNRRENLRIVTVQQNRWNAGPARNNTSGVKGVCYVAADKNYKAAIWKDNKPIWQRRFLTLAAASEALREIRDELHGEYACHGTNNSNET